VTSKESVKLLADDQWEQEVWDFLKTQFGIPHLPGYRLLRSGQKRIRIISKAAFSLVPNVPCAGPAGLYFGEYLPHAIRLTMDGAQLIGSHATKQIVTLSMSQAKAWLQGESIEYKSDQHGYVIVKHNEDILGCGSLSHGILRSYVPKVRRPKKQY
jgi:NOL1/NOP2/fmu family ribosome biogenesis protein